MENQEPYIARTNQVCSISTMRTLHEGLFSSNIGFAIAFALFTYAAGPYRPVYASKQVRECLVAFQSMLIGIAPLNVNQPRSSLRVSSIIWEAGFLVIMLGVALLLFLLLRLTARASHLRVVLAPVIGIAVVVAVPSCWLYIVKVTGVGLAEPQTFWKGYGAVFLIETATIGGILYLVRKGPIWLGALVFVFHYIFWVLVIGVRSGPVTITAMVLSLVFPCSGFAWLRYIQALRSQQLP